MNAYWALVKNDNRVGIKLFLTKSKWFRIYFIAAGLIWLVYYAIFLVNAKNFTLDPRYVSPVFIIVFIVTSGRIISNEWRRDTVGWWLSLPYSRTMLLGAKITASFIRFVKLTAIMIPTIIVLFFEALIIRPDLFTGAVIMRFFTEVIQLIVVLLAFSPFAVMSGIILRLVARSKWKPSTPLFWICILILFSFGISIFIGGHVGQTFIGGINMISSNGIQRFPLLILLEVLLVVILGFVSVYILENQVEV